MFQADGTQYTYPTTFDTDLVFYNYSPTDETYGKNNFKLFISSSGLPGSFTEYITSYTVSNNIITSLCVLNKLQTNDPPLLIVPAPNKLKNFFF